MRKPNLSIAALGGTICMSADGNEGVTPSLNADDLISAVPKAKNLANIKTATLANVASGSLSLNDLLNTIKWAKDEVLNGADGIIVTQGTDSLEESAFFCDLLWSENVPFIITGAMRNPDEIGTDGAANILASIIVAISENAKNRGVLVVLNDTIHRAKNVTKSDTFSLETFISVNGSIEGKVIEDEAIFFTPLQKRKTFKLPNSNLPKVSIVNSYLDDCGDMIKFTKDSGYNGVVIASFGAGHLSKNMMDEIVNIDKKNFYIIVSTRAKQGKTATKTYGYYGSEISLIQNGVIMSGWLSPIKSRLFLILLLSSGADFEKIKKEFKEFV